MHHSTQMETLQCLKHTLGFLKSTTYVLQCQEWKNMLATYGFFFFFFICVGSWIDVWITVASPTPHHMLQNVQYISAVCFSVRIHRDSSRPYLPVSHSGALCCCGFTWQPGSCVALLLCPALSLPFCFCSFLFHSTYFYHSYSWPPSGNDM